MPRRGENIRKRKDGRWEGRYIAGRTPDGKAIYKSVYGNSYAEVKEKLKHINQQPPKAEVIFSLQGVPVEMICMEWLEDVRVKIKESTRGNYLGHIEAHIVPYFKKMGSNQLTHETANTFIRAKIDSGLSKKTVYDIALILLQIIEFAERKKYISNFDYNDIFIPKASKTQVSVLSVLDDNKLVSYCFSHIDHSTAGILLARYTGIRLGELCALTWRDIDFEAGLLHIRKTLQRIKDTDLNATSKTKIIIDTPKSACSIRSIPIPDFFLSELKKLKGNQDLDCYVLSGTRKYVEPRLFQKRYTKLLILACVAYANIHVLRHTFATRAIALGFDIKALSEILGHASVKFTLECYVHSSDELKKMYIERQTICH